MEPLWLPETFKYKVPSNNIIDKHEHASIIMTRSMPLATRSSPLLRLAITYRATACSTCTRRLMRRHDAREYTRTRITLGSIASQIDSQYFRPSIALASSGRHVEPADVRTAAADTDIRQDASSMRRRGRIKSQQSSDTSAIPHDASAILSDVAQAAPRMSMKRHLLAYLALTKPRLAFLIVLTTTASYSLYPVPSRLTTSVTHAPSLSTLTLLFLTTGTFATIASANTLNMLFEPTHDAKMSRTRNRPLVRGLIKSRSAVVFAATTAIVGTGILYYGVNPTTAALGFANIGLYAFAYTPLKRISVINTWVGALVGAVPPLMGWCAAGGQYISLPTTSQASSLASLLDEAQALLFTPEATGGWLLAALLFAWQFPHFNALSHPIRHEYAGAGYKMCASLYPALNTRVALRYSILMFPICIGLGYTNITDRGFWVSSSIVNGVMLRHAWRFWRSGGGESPAAAKAARGLFWASIWNLPLLLVLAMVHKKGLWERVLGVADLDDEYDDDYEDDK